MTPRVEVVHEGARGWGVYLHGVGTARLLLTDTCADAEAYAQTVREAINGVAVLPRGVTRKIPDVTCHTSRGAEFIPGSEVVPFVGGAFAVLLVFADGTRAWAHGDATSMNAQECLLPRPEADALAERWGRRLGGVAR